MISHYAWFSEPRSGQADKGALSVISEEGTDF